jgi:hypothetical protein
VLNFTQADFELPGDIESEEGEGTQVETMASPEHEAVRLYVDPPDGPPLLWTVNDTESLSPPERLTVSPSASPVGVTVTVGGAAWKV